MQLYQRDDSPYWWGFFTVEGKQRRFSTKRLLSDKKSAQRILSDEYQKAQNRAQFGTKEDIALADAFDLAIHRVRKNASTARSYSTIKDQTLGFGNYAKEGKFGKDWFSLPKDITLAELKDSHVAALIRAREKHGHKDTTINVMLRVLKLVVNKTPKQYAVNRDLVFEMKDHFEKTRFLTRDEEEAVLAYLSERCDMASYRKAWELYVFLVDTGVRLGEALNLRWPKVNLSKGQIEVYRIKTRSWSMVPISNRVHGMLSQRQTSKQPFESMSRAIKTLRKVVDEVCNTDPVQCAQEGRATIHSLRDTYASRLVQNNMSLHKVSKLLGHTSTTMTRKYAHLVAEDVADEARRILNMG